MNKRNVAFLVQEVFEITDTVPKKPWNAFLKHEKPLCFKLSYLRTSPTHIRLSPKKKFFVKRPHMWNFRPKRWSLTWGRRKIEAHNVYNGNCLMLTMELLQYLITKCIPDVWNNNVRCMFSKRWVEWTEWVQIPSNNASLWKYYLGAVHSLGECVYQHQLLLHTHFLSTTFLAKIW